MDSIFPIPHSTTFKETDERPSHSHVLSNHVELRGKTFSPRPDGEEPEVIDLGWHPDTTKHDKQTHSALEGKVKNERVWMLVRRFDKQVQHVKVVTTAVPGGLDMNIADDYGEAGFTPNKLGVNLERMYMTVIVGIIAFGKHMALLRSWRDYIRTSLFFVGYFATWWLDLLLPAIIVLLMVLITMPKARTACFPPLVGRNLKKNQMKITIPRIIGGKEKKQDDSLDMVQDELNHLEAITASHEAVEADASSFVNAFGNIALSSAIGKEEAEGMTGDKAADGVESMAPPDITELALKKTAEATEDSPEKAEKPEGKKKKPIGQIMWAAAGPFTHILGDIADLWERVANALSPTPPFPKHIARLRIALLFIPALFVSTFISSYLILKTIGFLIGFFFFGTPITIKIEKVIVEHVKEIKTTLQARNTILKGVPTNAQLAITLLRIGEASMAPLPPPPLIKKQVEQKIKEASTTDEVIEAMDEGDDNKEKKDKDDEKAEDKDGDKQEHEHDWDRMSQDTHGEPDKKADKKDGKEEKVEEEDKIKEEKPESDDDDDENEDEIPKPKPKPKKSGFLSFMQYTAAGALHLVLGTDPIRAFFNNTIAILRLGVINDGYVLTPSGPIEFKARHNGVKGLLLISTAATVPCMSFIKSSTQTPPSNWKDMKPVWTVAVSDLVEVKKIGGVGWKARLVVGWAMEKEVVDGIEVVAKGGEKYTVTAIPLRDKLFDRLVAMGAQKWEVL